MEWLILFGLLGLALTFLIGVIIYYYGGTCYKGYTGHGIAHSSRSWESDYISTDAELYSNLGYDDYFGGENF